jgi:hypothetical protein
MAISWSSASIDLVAGPTELSGLDICDIHVVVYEQNSRHRPASSCRDVVAPTWRDRDRLPAAANAPSSPAG